MNSEQELSCHGCGACCRNIGKPPFLEHELASLPDILREEVEAVDERDAEPCIWLDTITGQCKNYEHRPFVCREFEVGSISCLAFRRYYNIDEY